MTTNQLLTRIPRSLNLENTLSFVKKLRNLPEATEFILDFQESQRIEPFAFLVLGSEIRKLRQSRSESRFLARNFEHCTYAGHMGFFKLTGLNFGKSPGEAKGSTTYVPIHVYRTADIRQDAARKGLMVGENLERTAKQLAAVLSQSEAAEPAATLKYSILEIFRNVLEHSRSASFAFCAQFWPQYDQVELAVLDSGIGIRASLSETHPVDQDYKALQLAISPGVSGKLAPGTAPDSATDWANAGLGLYMTNRLCREGGDFLLASGSDALFQDGSSERRLGYGREGTALRLRLKVSQIPSVGSRLLKFREEIRNQHGIRPSSTVSARSR